MTANVQRILVPASENEVEEIRLGLAYLLNYVKENQATVTKVMLFIPGLGNLEHTTLAEALGAQITKALQKDKRLKLSQSTSLELVTERTISRGARPDAVLAVYADMRMMDTVDSLKTTKLVVAAASLPDELNDWVRTWNASVHGNQTKTESPILSNPIVEEALKSLTSSVNLSNRTMNPRDESAADTMFRILRQNRQTEDPPAIRSWAIRNGWDPKGADKLEKLAQKILFMASRPALKERNWAEDIYQQWVAKSRR